MKRKDFVTITIGFCLTATLFFIIPTRNHTSTRNLTLYDHSYLFEGLDPPVFISANSTLINLGESVLFTSTISDVPPPYYGEWYVNETYITWNMGDHWIYAPAAEGTYMVFLGVRAEMGGGWESNVITVTVGPRARIYDPWADINGDGRINMYDITYTLRLFGTTGTAINKTALLLDLLARMDTLARANP